MSRLEHSEFRFRTGIGFDAHVLASQRKLMLGGVEIPHKQGLAGHSDGDVLLHAITDALLGALGLPDIGSQFPDTDPAYKDADSTDLLKEVCRLVRNKGYRVANVDSVVICDEPRLAPHADALQASIAAILEIGKDRVGIQAKTTEGTMLAIPGKSIAVLATVLLYREQ